MHENRKLFSYQWLCTESYLEFEASGNSDIAHLFKKKHGRSTNLRKKWVEPVHYNQQLTGDTGNSPVYQSWRINPPVSMEHRWKNVSLKFNWTLSYNLKYLLFTFNSSSSNNNKCSSCSSNDSNCSNNNNNDNDNICSYKNNNNSRNNNHSSNWFNCNKNNNNFFNCSNNDNNNSRNNNHSSNWFNCTKNNNNFFNCSNNDYNNHSSRWSNCNNNNISCSNNEFLQLWGMKPKRYDFSPYSSCYSCPHLSHKSFLMMRS